jgi:hypothetical protein
VPETICRKLPSLRDALGNPIRDLDRYRNEWQDSFRFTFIDPADQPAPVASGLRQDRPTRAVPRAQRRARHEP